MSSSRPFRTPLAPLTLLIVASLALSAAGCQSRAKRQGPKGVKVGFVQADGSSAYAQAAQESLQTLAGKRGFELIVQDAQGKASEQTRAVEQLLQQGVNVIIVRPLEGQKLAPALNQADESNAFVVTMDETVPDANVASFVESNSELVGQLAADYLGHRLQSGGRVAVLMGSGAADEESRLKAFRDYLQQKHPSIEVVTVARGGSSEAEQQTAAARLLSQHPELDAVFALTESAGLAAAEAARQKGGGGPFVVAYGGSPDAIEVLKQQESPLAMLLAPFPQEVGKAAGRAAWRIVSNKSQPSHVRVPVLPVTKETAGSFPGWSGQIPRHLAAPWPTDITIEMKRDDS